MELCLEFGVSHFHKYMYDPEKIKYSLYIS